MPRWLFWLKWGAIGTAVALHLASRGIRDLREVAQFAQETLKQTRRKKRGRGKK